MHNFSKTNATTMGEWHTASHIERQANKKEIPTAPPKAVAIAEVLRQTEPTCLMH